jgi:hypothetical protein
LQTLADVGQFSRREVDPLLLDLRTLVLAVGVNLLVVNALAERSGLAGHLLHGSRQVSQLTSDQRSVLLGCHCSDRPSLRWHVVAPPYA